MKRATTLALVLLIGALALTSGCARAASSASQPHSSTPSMADALGPTGLSRDSKSYMAADAP